MKHKKDLDIENKYYPNIASTESSGECTGMMHVPPQNEYEDESYQDMFDMEIPNLKNQADYKDRK